EEELTREAVRRKTLRAVAESVLRVSIVVIGGLFVLSNLGFNVTALLAGAGVVGLAISFAAQNLIRDFINGFFILLEDQYGMG
ncbi:mechanosensitive ion channel family protein, partial [Acinetobacter baumannii]